MATQSESFILIGSPPSSGSTLLSILLDKHSRISCGAECSILSNPLFYQDMNLFKYTVKVLGDFSLSGGMRGRALLELGLAPTGLIYEDHLESYGHTYSDVLKMLCTCVNNRRNRASPKCTENKFVKQFIELFFNARAQKTGKTLLAEKTPGNLFAVNQFLAALPEGKVILIVRHPYDTILSLVKRGYSLGMASAIYLTHASMCANYRNTDRCLLIKMEDLVCAPQSTLKTVFEFIGAADESEQLLVEENAPRFADGSATRLPEWSASPLEPINSKVLGKGKRSFSDAEKTMINLLCIENDVRAPVDVSNMQELAHVLGYSLDAKEELTDEVFALLLQEKIPTKADAEFFASYEMSRVYCPVANLRDKTRRFFDEKQCVV